MKETTPAGGKGWAIATCVALAVVLALAICGVASDRPVAAKAEAEAAALANASSPSEVQQAVNRAAVFRLQVLLAIGASAAALIAGGGLFAGLVLPGRRNGWWGLAVVPLTYILMYASSRVFLGEIRVWAVAVFAAALAAVAGYGFVVRRLGDRVQYVQCLGTLAVVALFLQVWEPPPPKPVPLVKSLVQHFPRTLAGWHGTHAALDKATEEQLGADEYLNLQLASPQNDRDAGVFITYNANAKSKVPHVPWVCMENAGYIKKRGEVRDVIIDGLGNREIQVNVLFFEPKPGVTRPPALMVQYFNVGGTYATSRELAIWLGAMGSRGQEGSYLSQTQVTVWLKPDETEGSMAKDSTVYRQAVVLLNEIVPLLEKEYYPDLGGAQGG